MARSSLKPLWKCPRCGHEFVSANLWHSCGNFEISDHFAGKDPVLRGTFDRLVDIGRSYGPLTVYAQKTRIVFMVRVRFANIQVRKKSLDFGLWLTRRVSHPLVRRIDVFGPRSYGVGFRLTSPEDIDTELRGLIGEAYKTGRQEHLTARPTRK